MCSLFTSFIISSIITGIISLNIDTTNPVIISDLFDGSGSFFGASVTLLNKDGQSSSTETPAWVIVGAPKANSTLLKQKSINEPGVSWRCSLGRKLEDFCEVLVMDPSENKFFPQTDSNGQVFDRKDGGWLGGVMHGSNSENGRFVSCASRWQNQWLSLQSNFTQHYLMNGICYWRPTTHLKTEGPVPELPENYRLIPLRNSGNQAETTEFIWAFGQAGFSLHITDDNKMLIGAPGMNHWRGGVIQFTDQNPASLRRNGSPDEYGGMFENVRVSSSKLNYQLDRKDSYLGYAVMSGKFLRSSTPQTGPEIQYVGGAPRGNNLFGKVVLFTFPTRGSVLNIIQEINGTNLGSYFGSVLCAVDVNKDGFDDLIIGAPQFSTKLNPKISQFRADPEPQSLALVKPNEPGDEGRVFVYMSSGTTLVKKAELKGGEAAGARFGAAISTVGDLNHDGYNDIAVGSPYENDGTGAVYIYFGGLEGLGTKHVQVIFAKNLHSTLLGFGYSLSQGIDVDGNGYNDLAVGSYTSAQTVILRTKPIVNLVGEIKTTIEKLPLNSTGFQFQACVSFTGKHAPANIDISMKISMDIDSKPARVHIRLGENSGTVTMIHNFRRVAYGSPSCETLTAVVVQPLVVSGSPITIRTEISLAEEKKSVSPTFYGLAAATNGIPKLTARGEKYNSFCADCPVQDLESSGKPTYLRLPLELPCGDDNKCVSDLRLSAAFMDVSSEKGFVIGSKPTLALEITMQNFGEAALSPTLKISWRRLNLLNVPSNCEPLSNSGIAVNSESSYLCRFGEILTSNEIANVVLVFDTKDLYVDQKYNNKFECDLVANTKSEMVSPTVMNLAIPLVFEGDIYVTAKDTSLPLSSESINPYQYFTHSFEVNFTKEFCAAFVFCMKNGVNIKLSGNITFYSENLQLGCCDVGLAGVSSLEWVWLSFALPVKLIGHLDRSIVEITNLRASVDGEIVICKRVQGNEDHEHRPGDTVQKLDINLDSELIQVTTEETPERKLRKREIEDSKVKDSTNAAENLDSSPVTKLARNGVIRMDCSADYVRCEEFECHLNKFKPSNQADIDFTLKILTEDIKKLLKDQTAESLHVISNGKAKISVPLGYEPEAGHRPDEADAVTRIELDAADVPKWVYMASFSGGIVGLVCLIFCFYFCGCFERKKKPEEEEEEVVQETEEQSKPLQSQTIHEEDETDSQLGDFSREETASPETRPDHYYFAR